MELDKSPLSIDIFSRYTFKKNGEKIIENFTPITKAISNENLQKPDENFPLDIGRKIIKDTLDRDNLLSSLSYYSQDYINKNIKRAIHHKNEKKKYVLTIESLIGTYKVSMMDLYKFADIKTVDDLLKFKFHPKDLHINKELFNVNHLIHYNLNYSTMIKYDIIFNLFVVQSYDFTFEELQTIGFNFEDCMIQTNKMINNFKDKTEINKAKSKLKEIFNKILKNQLSIVDMENLGLTKSHLEYIGISSRNSNLK
jgi:hypothetical protein